MPVRLECNGSRVDVHVAHALRMCTVQCVGHLPEGVDQPVMTQAIVHDLTVEADLRQVAIPRETFNEIQLGSSLIVLDDHLLDVVDALMAQGSDHAQVLHQWDVGER